MIKKVENIETYVEKIVISDPKGEEIVGTIYENELQTANQTVFRVEKIIQRKGDKLYIKWKGYDNSFNNWIDKNHIV